MNDQYLENSKESDALEEDVHAERDEATKVHVPDTMAIIPLRNTVFFPHQVMPLSVGREGSIRIVKEAVQNRSPIVLLAQKDPAVDKPTASDVHWFGTVGNLLKVFNLSDGSKSVIVQGTHRVRVLSFVEEGPAMRAIVQQVEDVGEIDVEGEALGTNIRTLFKQAVELSPDLTLEHLSIVLNMKDPGRVADVITSLINVSVAEKQQILESFNIKERLERAHFLLSKFVQRLEIGSKIQAEVQDEINKSQRDYYLREQLKAIQRELGEDAENVDIRELRERVKQAQLPEEVGKVADKELSRLSRMHPSSAEYTVSRTYLDWLLDLPWSKSTADNLNIVNVREALERDHYGLEKIKKRILEYLAVRKLKAEQESLQATPRGAILCFVGPPGVGKTSLGRSIANAIGRKFVRISLGGIHDEAEIRGHRRTYIGALPGRILQGLKKADSNNPVFMLDEVDKIGMDFRGDPSSALLEVLDPEQNFSFSDHYVEIPFDLSRVMFIATANTIDPIPPALRDRMEIIEIPSYTEDEKLNIAKRFLVPRQVKEHGLTVDRLRFKDDSLRKIIKSYTREAGVRNLERRIAGVARGVAREVAEGKIQPTVISEKNLGHFLGQPKFFSEVKERMKKPGIATGVAWTPFGGDILFVEATKMKGRGNLILTGQLGDIMKESAQAALSYIAAQARSLGIEEDVKEQYDVHVHVPAGAIPKDGPSAGVTMLTAMVSLFTSRPVRDDVVMTGEITLRGTVLPVAGIKEKVLAAHRSRIQTFILPERNKYDLEEIPEAVRQTMRFHLVKDMKDVLDIALREYGNGRKLRMSRGRREMI